MMLMMISQVIVNGLVAGFVYALTAAGFSLLYGNANILFLAIGEIYMLGAITFYVLVANLGLPYFVAMVLVVPAMGFLGVLLERFLFRPLKGSELTFAFATLALGMLIAGIALAAFGEQGKGLPAIFPGRLKTMGIVVPYDKIVIVTVALAILLGFHLYFNRTKTGRAIRAVSQDTEAALLMGVDVSRIKGLTFFLALGVAGAGGALVTPLYYADVFMGGPVLMTTMIVVVLGGLGSFPGAIFGGLLIGLVESFGYTFIGGITIIILFSIVIGLLIFRPQGLLGGEQ